MERKLETERLELVAATQESTRAEIENRPALAAWLRARVPESWPPPLNDEQSMRYNLRYLEEDPSRSGWAHWYLLLPGSGGAERELIGIAGFKGRPAEGGVVEVGYSVMEDRQKRGYGTEATGALIAWAFSHPEVTQVAAETLPPLRPSIRVMERNGMRFLGKGSEEGVIRYGITREEFLRR
jgi:RimJ/RimL family protein N-acetyltransferase